MEEQRVDKVHKHSREILSSPSIEDAITRYYEDENADESEVLRATENEAYAATQALKEISHSVPHLAVARLVETIRSNLASARSQTDT